MDPLHVESLLKFLGIHRQHWQVTVERTVLTSVLGFHFLHKVRFRSLSDLEAGRHSKHSDSTNDEDVGDVGIKRKSSCRSEAGADPDCTVSDSSAADNLMEEPQQPSRAH